MSTYMDQFLGFAESMLRTRVETFLASKFDGLKGRERESATLDEIDEQ